jgi:hypothetical protein
MKPNPPKCQRGYGEDQHEQAQGDDAHAAPDYLPHLWSPSLFPQESQKLRVFNYFLPYVLPPVKAKCSTSRRSRHNV